MQGSPNYGKDTHGFSSMLKGASSGTEAERIIGKFRVFKDKPLGHATVSMPLETGTSAIVLLNRILITATIKWARL